MSQARTTSSPPLFTLCLSVNRKVGPVMIIKTIISSPGLLNHDHTKASSDVVSRSLHGQIWITYVLSNNISIFANSFSFVVAHPDFGCCRSEYSSHLGPGKSINSYSQ